MQACKQIANTSSITWLGACEPPGFFSMPHPLWVGRPGILAWSTAANGRRRSCPPTTDSYRAAGRVGALGKLLAAPANLENPGDSGHGILWSGSAAMQLLFTGRSIINLDFAPAILYLALFFGSRRDCFLPSGGLRQAACSLGQSWRGSRSGSSSSSSGSRRSRSSSGSSSSSSRPVVDPSEQPFKNPLNEPYKP